MLSIFSASTQLSPIPSFDQRVAGRTVSGVLGAAVGQELCQTSTEVISRGVSIAPTIEIRSGYTFNVMVTQDPGPPGRTTIRGRLLLRRDDRTPSLIV